jgi:hypothetical protein
MLNSIILTQIYYIFRNQNTKKINLINENVVIIRQKTEPNCDYQSFKRNNTQLYQNVI